MALGLGGLSTAHAETPAALFCVFPQAKPLPECFKGSATSEESVHACDERNKRRKKVPPRVRIDKGSWITFAPDAWRCLPAPVGTPFAFQIENHGTVFYSARVTIPTTECATGRVDLTRPSFYGSMWAACSKRKQTDRDDVVSAP
ncbi:hypothetical protein BH11MYX2_BH11MYX2_35940 [soil metagenome]